MRTPEVGGTAERTWTVATEHSADRWGNEGLHVLATPILACFFENACDELIAEVLEAGEIAPGADVSVVHLAPTPVGMNVTVSAILSAADGRRLEFTLEACDDRGRVGYGTHSRIVIGKERFDRLVDERLKADVAVSASDEGDTA